MYVFNVNALISYIIVCARAVVIFANPVNRLTPNSVYTPKAYIILEIMNASGFGGQGIQLTCIYCVYKGVPAYE